MAAPQIVVNLVKDVTYTYQPTDNGAFIMRTNAGEEMKDILPVMPKGSTLIIKNIDNIGTQSALVINGDVNVLIDGQPSLPFSGLSSARLISDGANWWIY